MASKHHPLRRSCAFCRARKIKCSNGVICDACRRQGADCIYDFEASRPKARNGNISSPRLEATIMRGESPFRLRRQQSSNRGSSISSSVGATPVGTTPEDPTPAEEGETVAEALEQTFYCQSLPTDKRSPFVPLKEGMTSNSCPNNIKYNGILSFLAQDLVGLVTNRFGSLGCHHIENGGARFFHSGLLNDETQTMFDNTSLSDSPLSEYGQRQQTQLIDVWFSVHPLSFLVSKTLLLRELRDGTHDEILLAAMMADANFSIGDEGAIAKGHALLRWATAQLRTRPLRPDASSQNGGSGISTRMFSGIPTAQALMILGWSALCSSQARRAICYIGLAGKMATEIEEQMSSAEAPLASSRINGIDVFDVEKEIASFLYWSSYSISLWASLQMGNSHFSTPLLSSMTSIFPPVTETSSVIIQLDLISENFSTIQKQKSVIQDMWPLAHITSVVAYICGLYPHDGVIVESPTISLQQQAPLALHKIQQGNQERDITCIYRDINSTLMESIHALNQQVSEVSSRSLVLAAYHIMAIHFLFPKMPPGQPEEEFSEETIEWFYSLAEEISETFNSISEQPQDFFAITPSVRSSLPDIFCLALDASARALSLIISKRETSGQLMDMPMTHSYESKMEALTNTLYEMSRHDFLIQGNSLRLTKKQLKACLRTFGTQSKPNSSGFPSPDSFYTYQSMPHSPPTILESRSDHLSQETITAIDPTRPSVSPMDMLSLPSQIRSRMASVSDTTSSSGMNPPSPVDDVQKPEWNTTDYIFHDIPESESMFGATGDQLGASTLMDMQNAWPSQTPGVMDFEITGPVAGIQWNWPELSANTGATMTMASDMDPMLYYVDGGHHYTNKR